MSKFRSINISSKLLYSVLFWLVLTGAGCVNNFVPSGQPQSNNSATASPTISKTTTETPIPNPQPGETQSSPKSSNSTGKSTIEEDERQARATVDKQAAIIEVTELKKIAGDMVMVRLKVTNDGTEPINGGFFYQDLVATYLLDSEQQKKYQVVRDAKGKPLATTMSFDTFAPKSSRDVFVQFPAPPSSTQRMSIYFGGKTPILDLPLTP